MNPSVAWKARLPGTLRGASLACVGERVCCSVVGDNQRSLLAFALDGTKAWTYSYPPGQHNFVFPFRDRLYLDGPQVLCLASEDGSVLAAREFLIDVTQDLPSGLGPVFLLGSPVAATGMVGLDPITLETIWNWPDINAVVRRAWLREETSERGQRNFIHLPDLAVHVASAPALPAVRGQRVMFADALGLWCEFGDHAASAVSLPTGESVWVREPSGAGHHRVLWSTSTHAYAGVSELSAYQLSDGQLAWRQPVPGRLEDLASGTKDFGFVVVNKTTVHRVDLRTGELSGGFDAPGEIVGIAAIDDRRVVIGTFKIVMCVQFE